VQSRHASTGATPAPRTPFEERYLALAKQICLLMIPDPRNEGRKIWRAAN
jgi:hypothetical protein